MGLCKRNVYADDAGDSQVEEASVELHSTAYAPPAPNLYLSQPFPAAAAAFLTFPAGWTGTCHVSGSESPSGGRPTPRQVQGGSRLA